MSRRRRTPDTFADIEILVIKLVALACLLHTLWDVLKHEFGW
jgi:hypothetical protein